MLSTKPDSWNMNDFIPDLIIMVTFITHYFISENRQKIFGHYRIFVLDVF